MSPSTIDMILGAALLVFAFKGFMTGMIKSVVSFLSVVVAWFMATQMAHLASPLVKLALEPTSPGFPLTTRIVMWVVVYFVVQLVGSMIAKTANDGGLGGVDKVGGLALGVATGVIIGCLPLFVINAVPQIHSWPPVQQAVQQSFFLRLYSPTAAKVVPPPRKR